MNKKKKVVLYGVGNIDLRNQTSGYLSDNYEISCITDENCDEDRIQGERFVKFEDFCNEDFDYCVILVDDKTERKRIVENLTDKGINRNKIVEPTLFEVKGSKYIPDLIRDIDEKCNKNCENVVLGLSYSLRGFDYDMLSKVYGGLIDLSWHGQDMYYNIKLFEYFKSKYKRNKIRRVICVFPYYYFNYDMSRSLYQYETGQILALRRLDDWHNASNGGIEIRNFLICLEMFGERFWYNKRWKKIQPNNDSIMDNSKVTLDAIWKKKYQDTWNENSMLFRKFITQNIDTKITIVVPPIVKDAIEEGELIYYENMRSDFMKNIELYKNTISIIDLSDSIKETDLFYDYEHLNNKGRVVFTQKLINYMD